MSGVMCIFHQIGPLGRFGLVVAKSVHVWLAGWSVPFHAIFCMEELAWSPSYYTRGAHLITRVEQTGGWVQIAHHPRVEPSRGRVDRSTAPFLFIFFFKDKSCNPSKIVSVLLSASVERFDVSSVRDFY